MIVEYYFDRIEATEFLRRDVCEEVALAPYTVPREEVAPTVPRVNRWNRINRWNRNAAMNAATRDYLSGNEVECWAICMTFISSTTGWIGMAC